MAEWPSNGRMRETLPRSSKPTVVFVHNYAGNRDSSTQHQDMVLTMGFNCFSFDMTTRLKDAKISDWATELGSILDAIEGDKILYTFSFPSVSVPTLLARGERKDVRAWIADGGPFCEIYQCYWNLLTFLKYGNPLQRFLSTGYNYLAAGGPLYTMFARRNLARMQPLKILSIRNRRDPLVPPRAIDKFWALNRNLSVERVEIESRGHLDGIEADRFKYESTVQNFLNRL